MNVVLFSSDLMLAAAAQGAADRHGVGLVAASDPVRALRACGETPAGLLVIDLRTSAVEIGALVAEVRRGAPSLRIMACAPHVHEASLRAAQDAGCDEVVTRGEFERRLDAALQALAMTDVGDRQGE